MSQRFTTKKPRFRDLEPTQGEPTQTNGGYEGRVWGYRGLSGLVGLCKLPLGRLLILM